MLGAPSVGVMAGCVLVRACVQHLWKGKKALQPRYGSQRKYVRHRFNVARCAQIAAGCAPVLLAVMMAGCVCLSPEPLEGEGAIASKRCCKRLDRSLTYRGADVARCA